MTTYLIEARGCFQPITTTYTRENNACDSRSEFTEGLLTPWTDGTWWLDHDGETLVGWIEQDGVTIFPPLEFQLIVNAQN